jgi:hypothetical protein
VIKRTLRAFECMAAALLRLQVWFVQGIALSAHSRPVQLSRTSCSSSRRLTMPKAAASAAAPAKAKPGAAGHKTDERLASLRKEMAAAGVEAYIVPSEDPHQSSLRLACSARAMLAGSLRLAGAPSGRSSFAC